MPSVHSTGGAAAAGEDKGPRDEGSRVCANRKPTLLSPLPTGVTQGQLREKKKQKRKRKNILEAQLWPGADREKRREAGRGSAPGLNPALLAIRGNVSLRQLLKLPCLGLPIWETGTGGS